MTWETGICKKKKAGGTFPARKHEIVDGVIVHYRQETILQRRRKSERTFYINSGSCSVYGEKFLGTGDFLRLNFHFHYNLQA